MQKNYLESVKKQFEYYKMLGERTIEQLNEAELFWQYNPGSNSIAVIVNHLWGNMKSRWTDFLNSDGEKEWRHRDLEFENAIKTRGELLGKWNEGWHCLFDALNSINEDNFDSVVYIRNQGHTIVEAVNRQLAHYSYHIGQIVFLGKMVKGGKWKTLSIPKGKSGEFNKEKFSEEKRKTHFTDEFFKKKENEI
ncbi:dinB superfamily protein [bacterium BMS3Abin04]|nr:dinB superfamily protein [bacterium BMS3Abin04]